MNEFKFCKTKTHHIFLHHRFYTFPIRKLVFSSLALVFYPFEMDLFPCTYPSPVLAIFNPLSLPFLCE